MKKNLLNFSLKAIALMAILVIFTMCKRETECKGNCVPLPDATEQVAFNLVNKSVESIFNFYKSSNYYRDIVTLPSPDERLFQFLKEYCISKNITVDNQSMAFILYLDFPLSQSYSVTDEHLCGISLYQIKGRKINHHLFVKNENSEFYEIKNVNIAVPFVSHNHAHFYLENYVFSDPQNKSYIMIAGNVAKEVWKNPKKYNTNLRYEVKKIYSNTNPSNSKRPIGGTCSDPCTDGGTGACVCNSSGSSCSSGLCVASTSYNALSLAKSVEKVFIDLDLMYSFRDNLLYNSEKGEEYIDNYYYLSDEYNGKISFVLALKTALFFKDFNPVMEAMLHPDGHKTEIMFDNELSESLLNLLDEYAEITYSTEGKKMLKSIREDAKNFNNKTLQELLTMFQ